MTSAICRNCSQPCHPGAAYCCDQCAVTPTKHSENCPKGTTRREATVADLKVGDIFDYPDGTWHGPSRLTELSVSRTGTSFTPPLFKVVGENYKVVNPPFLSYDSGDQAVWIFDV